MLNCFGGCAAAFLPELRRGYALSNVYDHMIFTSPPGIPNARVTPMNSVTQWRLHLGEKADWETEHNGKTVSIPRPVSGLRVWDSTTHNYTGK